MPCFADSPLFEEHHHLRCLVVVDVWRPVRPAGVVLFDVVVQTVTISPCLALDDPVEPLHLPADLRAAWSRVGHPMSGLPIQFLKVVGAQGPVCFLRSPAPARQDPLSGRVVAGAPNPEMACLSTAAALTGVASLKSADTVTHQKASSGYGWTGSARSYAGSFHGMPAGVPDGVGVDALVPGPLALLGLCGRVCRQVLGLCYPVLMIVGYIYPSLRSPLEVGTTPSGLQPWTSGTVRLSRLGAAGPAGEAPDGNVPVLRHSARRRRLCLCGTLRFSATALVPAPSPAAGGRVPYGPVRQPRLHYLTESMQFKPV